MRISTVLLIAFTLLAMPRVDAESNGVVSVESPAHRVALLELYTSEGCSSCPPAERWLSSLKAAGISSRQIIPLAFHVTYWDYIGWRDRFGSGRYDDRQRRIAAYNAQRTIYTPQFVLSGDDYRNHARFANDVRKVVAQPPLVDLIISAQKKTSPNIEVGLSASSADKSISEVLLYLVVSENDLQSQVDDGENQGELLHHDYVVRQLYGPFRHSPSSARSSIQQSVVIDQSWKKHDLNLVAFAQHAQTGEVLQAVQLEFDKLD